MQEVFQPLDFPAWGFPQREKSAKLSQFHAGVAKLADAPDLGSGAERRGGSSPFTRTRKTPEITLRGFLFCLAL